MSETKLSERAGLLLLLIDEATEWEGDERPGRELAKFYVPGRERWCHFLRERVIDAYGAGDARILSSFIDRRLVRQIKPHVYGGSQRYWLAVTEEGVREAEKVRERYRAQGKGRP